MSRCGRRPGNEAVLALTPVTPRRLAAVTLLLLLVPGARTHAEESAISIDRPSFSNSADTVPRGAVQIESGIEYSRERVAAAPAEQTLSLDTLLRVGLGEHIEVRLDWAPFIRIRGEQDDTGPGDLTLGVKYRLLDATPGGSFAAVAVQPLVKVPIAEPPLGSGRPDFTLVGIASVQLPADFSLDVNLGIAALGQRHPSGYLAQGQASGALTYRLTDRLSVYGELFFFSQEERNGRHQFGTDDGLIYLVTPTIALDVAVQASLAGGGPDFAVRAGASFRFGR
jgi:outer membrane putative beta-barrel porin/alpha-amylase